jgi:hypothetical protein
MSVCVAAVAAAAPLEKRTRKRKKKKKPYPKSCLCLLTGRIDWIGKQTRANLGELACSPKMHVAEALGRLVCRILFKAARVTRGKKKKTGEY